MNVNEANQIETITGGWKEPTYDDAGNMISGPGPKTGDETTRVHYVYDAWNRLVAVLEDDGYGSPDDTIAEYRYDGLGRRIKKTEDPDGPNWGSGWGHHYYYNTDWQILEDREVDEVEAEQNIDQYVWSPRYIDAPMVCLHDGDGGYGGTCDGDVAENYPGDWRRYYLTDAQHNVTTTGPVRNLVSGGPEGV